MSQNYENPWKSLYRSWKRSWTHTCPRTYHEPVFILEPIMNPYLFWNRSWTRTDTGTYHKPVPILELILNPFRSWNLSWTHSGPGTNHEPIPVLEPIINPYRTRKSLRFHLFFRTVPGTVPDSDSDAWILGPGVRTNTVPVDKPYPVLDVQRRK